MNEVVIRGKELSKLYRIGRYQERYSTFRDAVVETLASPLRLFRGVHPNGEDEDTIWALKNVSFEVRRGEVLGIIGANGAGKSTLLKILSRITEPSSGYVDIHGRVGSLLEVGTGFHPELTGRENIYLNGAILGMRKSEIDDKFDEIVAFSEVEKFIDTPVKRYSSGMHVRLAFAVAAHLEPEILMIDEVLAVGDLAFQKKCLGKMHDVAGSGRTVIFVSHNMGTIKTLCDRCILLKEGSIVADGPSDKVVDSYIEICTQRTNETSEDGLAPDRGTGFALHLRNGGETTVFCGDPITFEFNIEAIEPPTTDTVGVAIRIFDSSGVCLVGMDSHIQERASISRASPYWTVRCELGRLPINAGTYFVSIFACVYIKNELETYAEFSNVLTVRVLEHDVFGWGKGLPAAKYWGLMYWSPKWDIRPAD